MFSNGDKVKVRGGFTMSDSSTTLALFGLIGACIGAIPGVLNAAFTWFKNKDAVSRSLKEIELAKSEVEFISSWLETVTQFDDDEELIRQRQSARSRLGKLMCSTEERIERRALESVEVQAAPKKSRASLAFYIYTGFFVFMVFGASIDATNSPSVDQLMKELSGEGGVILLVFGIPWLVLFVRFLLSKRK
jgi:hypothetical protein